MVTYRRCQAKLLVRFQPLHFLCLFLFLCFWLSGSSSAIGEIDSVYSHRDDVTLADVLVDADSGIMPLATIYRYTVFGRTFTYDADTQQVTRINGFSDNQWANFDTGDRLLASVVLDTLLGVEDAIDAVAADVVVELDKWVNDDMPGYDIKTSKDITNQTVPNLLAALSYNTSFMYQRLGSTRVAQYLDPSSATGVSSMTTSRTVANLLAVLSGNDVVMYQGLRSWLNEENVTVPTLLSSGQTENLDGSNITQLTRMGFNGLASLFAGSGDRVIHVNQTDLNDPLSDAGFLEFPSLFDYLGYYGEQSLRELTKLRFVLASDDDIQMKQEEKPNEDAVKDNFFGDGDGSVKPSDISDAAGLTSSAKDTFGGSGSAGDVFVVAGDQSTYSFFSQAVANDLDTVNSPAVVSEDDWMADLPQDEDGFYYNEFLSPSDYLRGR